MNAFRHLLPPAIALLLTTTSIQVTAQAVAADPLDAQLKGVWVFELQDWIGSFRIARLEKSANGDVNVEATWLGAPAKVSVNEKVSPTRLEVTTRAGTVLSMQLTPTGSLSGKFAPRSGPSGEALATRVAPNRDQSGVAQTCGVPTGVWDGTWSQGNLGTNTLWIKEIGSDCKAVIRYNRVTESVMLQSGEFSFACNPSTGGTCSFKVNGNEIWASYANPTGGRNSGVFKPLE